MSSKQAIVDYWAARVDECGMPVDWCDAATHCWACGSGSASLEMCHIIPKSMGGTADPSNLVLLCRTCHNHAPDSTDPSHMWVWLRGCGPEGRLAREARSELAGPFAQSYQAALASVDISAVNAYIFERPELVYQRLQGLAERAMVGVGIHPGPKGANAALMAIDCLGQLAKQYPVGSAA